LISQRATLWKTLPWPTGNVCRLHSGKLCGSKITDNI